MPTRNIVVIGASAGGLEAVRTFVHSLPKEIPASIFVVIHTSPDSPGLLASILDRVSPVPVFVPRDGATIREGCVYVAPPDEHLIIEANRVRLTHGPREHRFRPAVDPLFRSAAEYHGPRVIGIVLSGHMADGAHGLMVIKQRGGVAIVQDPEQAQVPSMPLSALSLVKVDHVLRVEEMASVVVGIVMNNNPRRKVKKSARQKGTTEVPSPERPDGDALKTGSMPGPPSPLTCPDCGGSLWELKEPGLLRYRCHVGHGFSAESLGDGMNVKLEDTLWSALRAMEELIELRKRMLDRSKGQQLTALATTLEGEVRELEERAAIVRELLLSRHADPGTRVQTGKRKVNGRKAS
jgi:two-component system, chemotaxis family, protein-glutamate methylesterase/glutaminase